MLCPNCKKDIENGSTFCEHCGTRVKKSKKGLWITLSIIFMAIFVAIIATLIVNLYQINQYESKSGYVDLGLPSGTLWKNANEGGKYAYYTYDEAVSRFGNELPTVEQFRELQKMCNMTRKFKNIIVTGPNGNSILFPTAGLIECDGEMFSVGTQGHYWSSTPYEWDHNQAYNILFDLSPKPASGIGGGHRCNRLSVRLVN